MLANNHFLSHFSKLALLLLIISQNAFGQQPNFDTIFTLKGFDRLVVIRDLCFANRKTPGKIAMLSNLIKNKGNETDNIALNKALDFIAVPDSLRKGRVKITIPEKYLQASITLNDHFITANCYYDMSEGYKELMQYNKSFEYKLYCLDELKKDPDNSYYKQAWFLHQVASEYYRFNDYAATIQLCKDADKLGGRYTPNGKWFIKVNTNLVGMAYVKDGKYDSAVVWLNKTMSNAIAQKDTMWMGIATGNLGIIKERQKNYTAAIPLYEQGLTWCRQTALYDNIVSFCSSLANCYLQKGNTNAAASLLEEAMEANKRSFNLPNYLPNQVKLYSVAEAYFRKIGNNALTLRYSDSVKKYVQNQEDEFNINIKTRDEAILAYRNKALESEIAIQKLKNTRLLIYGLLTIMLLIGGMGILYAKRRNLSYMLKQEKAEHEADLAREALSNALIEINDFTYHIVEKNKLIESYTAEIEKLQKQNNTITDEQLASVAALRNATVLTDAEWTSFKNIFEKVHPGYLNRLKLNYPDLTPAETRYLVFTKLNITSKEMAAMLGVSAEAVRNIRFRLKKKLDIEDNNELDRMANDV